jgi:hypothetical protein
MVLEALRMKESRGRTISRRHLLRGGSAAAGAAAASALLPRQAAARPLASKDKRRARYQANSAEVQNFYRVNSYPAR